MKEKSLQNNFANIVEKEKSESDLQYSGSQLALVLLRLSKSVS